MFSPLSLRPGCQWHGDGNLDQWPLTVPLAVANHARTQRGRRRCLGDEGSPAAAVKSARPAHHVDRPGSVPRGADVGSVPAQMWGRTRAASSSDSARCISAMPRLRSSCQPPSTHGYYRQSTGASPTGREDLQSLDPLLAGVNRDDDIFARVLQRRARFGGAVGDGRADCNQRLHSRDRPHLRGDSAHICAGIAPTSAPGQRPHLAVARRD